MRIYNLLLRLYPASFRNEYGDEMRALFARRPPRATGPFGALRALARRRSPRSLGNAVARARSTSCGRILRYTAADAAPRARLRGHRGADRRARHRRDDRGVLGHRLRPAPAAAVSRARSAGRSCGERTPGYGRIELSPANYRDWKAASTVVRAHRHVSPRSARTCSAPASRCASTARRSPPICSRRSACSRCSGGCSPPSDDRAGAAGTVLLSYRLWQTRFGGDPGVVGQQLLARHESHTVIGVMPREFRFPSQRHAVLDAAALRRGDLRRSQRQLALRRRPAAAGVTLEQARAEMDAHRRAASRQQYPEGERQGVGASVIRFSDEVSQQSRLLLIALVRRGRVRAADRLRQPREPAARARARAPPRAGRPHGDRRRTRAADPPADDREPAARRRRRRARRRGRGDGGAAACRLVPATLPIASAPTVDLRVLLFAIGADRRSPASLRPGAGAARRRRGRPRRAARGRAVRRRPEGAAALGAGRRRDRRVGGAAGVGRPADARAADDAGQRPGLPPEGVLTLRTPLPMPKYGKLATREAFYTRVLDDVRALPGVTDAGFISYLPIGDARRHLAGLARRATGRTAPSNQNALPALRHARLLRARSASRSARRATSSESDTRDRQFVAVVSESFVKRYWPDDDPASASAATSPSPSPSASSSASPATCGCAASSASEPQVYLSYKQVADGCDHRLHPAGACWCGRRRRRRRSAPSIRAIIRRADPELPISEVSDAHRRRRSRDRVARGAGARARRVRGDRVRARRHRHPRPAVVRRVAARAGDRRAHGARRAVERHPVDGGAALGAAGGRRRGARASRSPMPRAGAWRRCSPASSRPTR